MSLRRALWLAIPVALVIGCTDEAAPAPTAFSSPHVRPRVPSSSGAVARLTAPLSPWLSKASAALLVASSAASFTKFARSAPENPGVSAAIESLETIGAARIFFR